MSRVRGFEVVTKYKGQGLELPKRATKGSAGYDFAAAINITLPSIWNILTKNSGLKAMEAEQVVEENKEFLISTLVPTGIKAYMPEREYLMLVNRSSNPGKKGLILANSIGIVDKDYYGNEDNDGHIMFAFYNIKDEDIEIKKGDVIGQAIFQKYLTVDNDKAEGERVGGFGSTSK